MERMAEGMEAVFRALADPTRRHLLDRLHERNGQTLTELCAELDMARQSATQHLAVLEAANLISVVRRGREKFHYLNPVPLHEVQQRWIHKFEQPRLRTLSRIKRRAEEPDMSDRPSFVYTTYIQATPEVVWHALTDAELTADYWGHSNVSDWTVGAGWQHVRTDGSGIADIVGTILESDPPRRLVLTFAEPGPQADESPSLVTFEVEPHEDIVRLTVTHVDFASVEDYEASAAGWPAILANLKSLLETGSTLPQPPWEMHADLRAEMMSRHDA